MPRALAEAEFLYYSPTSAERITKFCNFMLADIANRMPCLRTLKLSGKALWDNEASVRAMVELLGCTTRLTELYLHDAAQLFVMQPSLADAIAALTTLDIVRMTASAVQCDLLARFSSRPRRLELELLHGAAIHLNDIRTSNLPPNLAGSVEEMFLNRCVCLAENSDVKGIIFPHVRKLVISGPIDDLSALASVFPQVASVHFMANVFGAEEQTAAWTHLDHVKVGMYPAFRLACPVRRVDLLCQMGLNTSQSILEEFVGHMAPAVLLCAVEQRSIHKWMTAMATHTPALRYSHMAMPTLDGLLIDETFPIIAGLPLVGISLGYTLLKPPFVDEQWATSLARQVASLIPALQFVGVNRKDYSSTHSDDLEKITWYRVLTRRGGSVQVQQQCEWEGNATLRQLLNITWE
ncbi:hypothetical protein IEO21_10707 [Rhodonia placenta]|uniref:Uncharacterized protein n=1 Tax=Rhodonia placenta TaxID=104341 RepID=A0A8H7NS15_9APHY|nr:hypothetical protein IEO21_10707 [Postia placenta]